MHLDRQDHWSGQLPNSRPPVAFPKHSWSWRPLSMTTKVTLCGSWRPDTCPASARTDQSLRSLLWILLCSQSSSITEIFFFFFVATLINSICYSGYTLRKLLCKSCPGFWKCNETAPLYKACSTCAIHAAVKFWENMHAYITTINPALISRGIIPKSQLLQS